MPRDENDRNGSCSSDLPSSLLSRTLVQAATLTTLPECFWSKALALAALTSQACLPHLNVLMKDPNNSKMQEKEIYLVQPH